MTSFISSVSDGTRADSGNTDHLSLLNQLPLSPWAKSPTDIGKFHSSPPIKIRIDPLKPLSRILSRHKALKEDCKAQASLSLVAVPVTLLSFTGEKT